MSSKALLNSRRLLKEDINISCKDLATYLLGKVLVRKLKDSTILKGRIVETECYLGTEDKASQTFGGRRTPKNEPLYKDVGTAYIYMTYGMYYCFNISSPEPGAAVLLRALHPLSGLQEMESYRLAKNKSRKLKETDLCNGPSKLCMALEIRKDNCNDIHLCESEDLWLEDDPEFENDFKVVHTSRIGIASAGKEWAEKPFRFYILGCPHVSKRDKLAEELLTSA